MIRDTGLAVGIIRDQRYLEHKTGHVHPEHPKRLRAVYRMLDHDFAPGLIDIEPEMATMEQLEFVHTPAHIEKVLKTADHNFTSLAPDTPASAKTYLSACLAVGGCIRGLEALFSGQCDVCFSLVRPPGHHALPNRANGFCIFNNLGITARFAHKRYNTRRILILDYDVHHGNGLNELFYEQREVFYFSTHDIGLYPYTGDWKETGIGEGEGYTVNVPVPRTVEDQEFLYLYRELLGSVIRRYRPELILVAAGFDAHKEDPIGRSQLTELAFQGLSELLLELREEVDRPPLLFALEGGYDPPTLARCVRRTLEGLLGEPPRESIMGEGSERVNELVEKARQVHRRYGVWVD